MSLGVFVAYCCTTQAESIIKTYVCVHAQTDTQVWLGRLLRDCVLALRCDGSGYGVLALARVQHGVYNVHPPTWKTSCKTMHKCSDTQCQPAHTLLPQQLAGRTASVAGICRAGQ